MPGFDMNEDPEAYNMIRDVVKVVNRYYPEGVRPSTVAIIITQFMMQLRLFYTHEEVHAITQQLVEVAEANVVRDDWVDADTGEAKPPPILVEQVRNNPDGLAMLQESKEGISDEALRELLDGEQ